MSLNECMDKERLKDFYITIIQCQPPGTLGTTTNTAHLEPIANPPYPNSTTRSHKAPYPTYQKATLQILNQYISENNNT